MSFNKKEFEEGIQNTNRRNVALMRREMFGEDTPASAQH